MKQRLSDTKIGKKIAIIGWCIGIPALLIMFLCNREPASKKQFQSPTPIYIQNNQIIKPFPACISQAKFDEMIQLSVRNDYAGIEYLNKRGVCFEMAKGAHVSVLDRHKFRLYKNDGTHIDLYTAYEFLITRP